MVGIGKTLKNKICLSIVRALGRPTDGFVLNVGYPPGFARVASSGRTYTVNLTARLISLFSGNPLPEKKNATAYLYPTPW